MGFVGCVMLLMLVVDALSFASTPPASSTLNLSQAEQSWLAAHPVVNIRVSRDYPPFEFFADGKYQGIAVDYLDLVAKRLGITFRPAEGLTWPESLDELREHGKVDAILLITRAPERESFIEFTRDYVSFPWVVFTRTDSPSLGSVVDLNGKMVAVERGFIAGDWLKRDLPDVRFFEVNRTRDALEAVMLGHADAYLGNLAVGSYLIARDGLVDLKVAASTPETPDTMAMGVRKDWPELAQMIDRALASMSEEEHRTIRQKWLKVRYEHGIRPLDVIKWVAIVAAVCLAWVFQLRLTVNRKTRKLHEEIAHREEQERELARSLRDVEAAHGKLQELIERTPLGYIEFDHERRITDWNPAANRLLGWTRDDVLGHMSREFGAVPADEDSRVQQIGDLHYTGQDQQTQMVVLDVLRKDGARRRCEWHVTPSVDTNGQVCGAKVMFADITDRLRLEEQLVQSEKILSVGGMAAGLAHEINNPLAGIMQNLQVAQQRLGTGLERNREVAAECDVDLTALQRYLEARKIPQMLASIGEAAERTASIVRNMLNFSRKSYSNPVASDLRQLLDQALELAASDYDLLKRFDFRTIEIVRDYAANLPLVDCEPTELQQVFLNLLKNGAQAMAGKNYASGAKPRFILRLGTTVEGKVQMEAEDNGPGMSEETRRRVFEPFFTTKEAGEGTGLGLSISYFIVSEHHGGTIEVRSQDGFGTTFTVTLPLTAARTRA